MIAGDGIGRQVLPVSLSFKKPIRCKIGADRSLSYRRLNEFSKTLPESPNLVLSTSMLDSNTSKRPVPLSLLLPLKLSRRNVPAPCLELSRVRVTKSLDTVLLLSL